MPFCVIPDCDTNVSGSTDITLHRIPKALVPLARWVVALGLGPLPRGSHVCSRHFEASMFTEHGTLTLNAVPKRILDIPLNNKPSPKLSKGSDEEELNDSLFACRACLAADGRLYAISGSGLEDTLAALTGIAMPAERSFPRHLCVFCMAKLSKCAAFRESCQRSTKLLNSLSEKGPINMNDIKTFKQQSSNLTLEQIFHFGSDSFIDLMPIIKKENKNSSHEVLEHKENEDIMKLDPSDVDHSTLGTSIEKLKSKFGSGIENLECMEFEVGSEDTNGHSEIDDWIESEVANDVSDVDTDSSEDALITVKKRRKTGLHLNSENVVNCPEKYGNGKPEADDHITNEDTNTLKKTTVKKERMHNANKRKRDNMSAFSCDLCGKNFRKESTLTAHKRGHGKNASKKSRDPDLDMEKNCNFDVKILSKEEQRQNIKEMKSKRSMFGCDLCGKNCREESSLEAHKASCHDTRFALECDVCLHRFRRRRNLLWHRDRHRAVYTCRECGNVYRTRKTARDHYLMHRGKTYTCPYCQMKYDRRYSYYAHVQLQHPDKNEPCDECGETFAGAVGLAVHKLKQHNNRANDKLNAFKCKACDVKFLNAEALKKHEESGSGVPHAALWPCAACGDSTGSEVALAAHAAEKHPTNQLYCKECDKTFSNASSFALHDERKHKNRRRRAATERFKRIRIRRKVCEVCGKLFMSLQQLEFHMNIHLGLQPFQCAQCPKAFTNKVKLRLHMRMHTGEKPYQCEQCAMDFSNRSNFTRHIKNVHEQLQVECELCGKMMRACSLSGHVRTVHINQPHVPRKRTRTKKPAPAKS